MRNSFFTVGARKLYCFADSLTLCEELIESGAEIIQLRAKGLENNRFLELAEQMQALVNEQKHEVKLIINDNVEVAFVINSDGLHLGQDDTDYRDVIKRAPKQMSIGVSVKTVEQAIEAQEAGAAYLGAGAVFSSATKSDSRVIGLHGLEAIVRAVEIPVVAIGGINRENIQTTIRAGASYCAVISAINNASEKKQAFELLMQKIAGERR